MEATIPPAVCFIHVPKTAGTSLAALLAQHYPRHQVSRARLLFDLGQDPEESSYRLWHGHFGLTDVIDYLPPDVRFIAALRHPLQRVQSLYHYWRAVDLTKYGRTPETDPNYYGVMLAIKSRSIDEFLATDDPTILREISDSMTRYLSGSLYDIGPVSVEKAIDAIDEGSTLVVRQNHFQHDAALAFRALFDVRLTPEQIVFHNRQSYEARLTFKQQDRILELNPSDTLLYQHASESMRRPDRAPELSFR
jgi:hypothetical protein